MVTNSRTIDLHTHTVFSDGALSPGELVQKAKEVGLAAIAITDHDNIDGLEKGIAVAKKFGVELIPGVEITSYPDTTQEFHFLGFFVDWKNKSFQKTLKSFQEERRKRAEKVINNLNSFGYQIDFVDLRFLARGTIVQPHIAWLVINDTQNRDKLIRDFGKIPTTGDFIVKYLIPGAPAYEPRETIAPKEAIELIHAVRGIAILAHPCWSLAKKQESEIIFNEDYLSNLIKFGLDGLEVYAHRETEADTKLCVKHFEKTCQKENLLITGGSDYHGFGSAGKALGFTDFYLKVSYEVLDDLKSKI